MFIQLQLSFYLRNIASNALLFFAALIFSIVVTTVNAGAQRSDNFTPKIGGGGPGSKETLSPDGTGLKSFAAYPIVTGANKNKIEIDKITLTCTSTLIGPNVLLTAAHCLKGKTKISIFVEEAKKDEDKVLDAICTPHPHFITLINNQRANQTSDFAICLLPKKIENVTAEWIATNLSLVISARRFHLLGYGCDDIAKRKEEIKGKDIILRDGPAFFIGNSNGFARRPYRDNFVLVSSKSTNFLGDGAYLCSGDSGGPVMLNLEINGGVDNISERIKDGRRVLVAVNTGILAENHNISLISKTTSLDFAQFLRLWLQNNPNAVVCHYDEQTPEMFKYCREMK